MQLTKSLKLQSNVYSVLLPCSISFKQLLQQMTPVKQLSPFSILSDDILLESRRLNDELDKIKELNFIFKQFFGKLEKIIYNKESFIFEKSPFEYERAELHMRQILRRLQDIHNSKLNSLPTVYRKDNVKVYKQIIVNNSTKQ